MPTFKYIAYDTKGRKKEGIIEAPSSDIAVAQLKKSGLYTHTLTGISEKKSTTPLSRLLKSHKKVSQKARADMFFQLATLIETGIPLTEALDITAEQSPKAEIRDALKDVKDRVSEGMRLSEALSRHGWLFTETYIRMIEIAEKTGKLAEILFKISTREEEKSSFNQKIAPIVLYPAFVLTLGIGIVGFLLVYVVPKMEKIFASFHKKLPLITRMLIATGIFIKKYLLLILIIIALLAVALRLLYLRVASFRRRIDALLLRIGIYRKVVIAQFTSALAFQLEADIKLVDAIKGSAYVVKNTVFIEKAEEIADKINKGVAIDRAFKESGLFDKMFIASLATGTKSGRLPDFIRRISIYYDKKLSALLKSTISLVEPVAILTLGLIVGFIVMSIMVPLFNINQLVK